jgi:hypothetical protein
MTDRHSPCIRATCRATSYLIDICKRADCPFKQKPEAKAEKTVELVNLMKPVRIKVDL